MGGSHVAAALPEAALAQYQTDGYCVLEGVFADRLDALREPVDRARSKGNEWHGPWVPAGESISLVAKHDVHQHPAWAEAIQDPVLVDAVRAVMGCEPIFDRSTIVAKPPETGQPFPPHQDAEYYAGQDPHFVVGSVYLDDATEDNGPIRVLPGSHRHGLLRHERPGIKAYLPDIDVARMVPVMAKAGDVVLFSLFMVHASLPNRSSAVRRTVRLGWRSR